MDSLDRETNKPSVANKRQGKRVEKQKNKKIFKIIIFVLGIVLWCFIVYQGYNMVKDYIDMNINNIKQENALNIQELNDRIGQLSNEINDLNDDINDADDALSDSEGVQKRIDVKLRDLDEQLGKLRESLEVLKEAPNGKN